MGLELVEPATEQVVDEALDVFRKERINSLNVYHIPHSQPDQLSQWLQARNLRVRSGWDRIYRGDDPLVKAPGIAGIDDCRVERVAPETAAQWADFIVAIYGLQALADGAGRANRLASLRAAPWFRNSGSAQHVSSSRWPGLAGDRRARAGDHGAFIRSGFPALPGDHCRWDKAGGQAFHHRH